MSGHKETCYTPQTKEHKQVTYVEAKQSALQAKAVWPLNGIKLSKWKNKMNVNTTLNCMFLFIDSAKFRLFTIAIKYWEMLFEIIGFIIFCNNL